MKKILPALFAAQLAVNALFAQEPLYTQFNATPLLLNPAFTGMIDGSVRGNVLYKSNWITNGIPYISYTASCDGRSYSLRNGDYIGAGISMARSSAGDGNLENFSALVSGAYHKTFGNKKAGSKPRKSELAVGVQAGYAQATIDLTKYHVQGPFLSSPTFQLSYGNTVGYYRANAGVAFAQQMGEKLDVVAGLSVNNFNQPNDALLKKQTDMVGLRMRYTATAGGNIRATKKLTLRPAMVYYNSAEDNEFMGGSEFMYHLGKQVGGTNVFCGLWYRSAGAMMYSAGAAHGRFRGSASYERNPTQFGGGSMEMAVTYTGRGRPGKRLPIACNRF